jgi:fructose-1,6-bisphosphatase II
MERELTGRLPYHDVTSNLSLALVRVTEAAALACGRQIGRGDQEKAKEVAASAMLQALEDLDFHGRVALGPRGDGILSYNSTVGPESSFQLDVGVYPVDGASLVARGLPNAISMVVAVEPGGFMPLPAVAYAEKVAVGPAARGAIDLDDSIADNLRRIAFSRDARVSDLTVAVLDRPRHHELVEDVRAAGARVIALADGDIAGALMAAVEGTGVDAMIGIGGLQEASMAATALRCLGGEIQCRLWPRNDEERILAGEDVTRTYGAADLVPADVSIAITGISGGPLLDGVWFGGAWAETSSLVMSSRQATVRRIRTRHHRLVDKG